MDDQRTLMNSAIAYLQKYGILQNFQISAVNHSQKCSEASSLLTPLIIHFEVDLILLCDSSSSLYEKVVQHPAEGRRIFQEAISDHLRDYLLEIQCRPISCIQLLMRCKFLSILYDGNSLFAKSYGCLSYVQRYVLTSVTISHSDKCNLSTMCTLKRCPSYNCPGHAGKYISMEELTEFVTLDNCVYCGQKYYEDAAGRGTVRKVMAKFTSVMAFNCRDEKNLNTAMICSITDPLIKELELGDMYDIWGRYDVSIYEIWGLKRTTFFRPIENISSSLLPPSIATLWTLFGKPNDPWNFGRNLALEIGSNIGRNRGVSVKMGLLLSLASLGSNRCASILCVGPKVDNVEEDILQYAANYADRNVPLGSSLHANITTNGQRNWLHGGSLVIAKTGVCNVGDWESLKPAQKNELMEALDHGYIIMGEKNGKSTENERMEYISSSLPLKTAVWTYREYKKNCGQRQSAVLENLVNLFGIPFLVDIEESVTEESIHEHFELILNGGKTNPHKVPIDEFIKYLRIVNGIAVTLSEDAARLIKNYFVASREVRKNGFPAQSITFMTTLAEAHARISLRNVVTYDDVVAIIYFYEESMYFLHGYSTPIPPPFMRNEIDAIAEKMSSFKIWLKSYLNLLAR